MLVENNRLNDLEYLCEPTLHERRFTFRVICSRSISHEWVRSRTLSYSQESQRYCAYNKDKFNGELTFIIPQWVKDLRKHIANCTDSATGASQLYLLTMDIDKAVYELCTLDRAVKCWYDSLENCEKDYMFLITDQELKPEEARSILPNDCKTELVVTGFESDWSHFLSLRLSTAAHPDIRVLAEKLSKEIA